MPLDIEQYPMRTRIQWVMVTRLAIISVSLALGLALFNVRFGTFRYYICFYYAVSLLYIAFLQRTRHYTFLGAFQIAVDLMAITIIVAATGPIEKVYGNLYLVPILFANLLFRQYGSVLTSVLSSLLFAVTVLVAFYKNPDEFRTRSAVYVTYIYLIVFLGVGYVSYYVSKLLQQKTEEVNRLKSESDYVFHNIGTGMLMASAGGAVHYANPAAARMLGRDEESLRDVHWHRLLGIDDRNAEVRDGLARGGEAELDARDARGGSVPVAVTVSPVQGPRGVHGYNIILFRDLREQREHEKRVREATRLSGIVDLSATIAHEIRNPLASLSGSAELLLDRLADHESRRLAQTIIREVERVDSIVEDFLSFTRLRSMEPAVTDLTELVTDIVVLLHHSRRFHAATKIVYQELPAPFKVVADPRQLKQALLNIGLNALDAMPRGGALEIAVRPEAQPGMVEIAVRDTGCGMASEVQARMFEPFFSTKEEGSGIGLYVAQRVIEGHRGTIAVESAPGKGTAFRILIPIGTGTAHDQGNEGVHPRC